MASKSEGSDEPLLPDPQKSFEEARHSPELVYHSCRARSTISILLVFVMVLIINNGAWVLREYLIHRTSTVSMDAYPPFQYTNSPFYHLTEYSAQDDGKAEADQLWKNIFPLGNGVLSLDSREARSKGLSESVLDPARPGKEIYIVSGYHTLHCLTVVRTALFHFHHNENQTQPWNHLVHCLDQMRQALQCNIDTTLLVAEDPDHFKNGQPHTCKDFWGLHKWMTEHAG